MYKAILSGLFFLAFAVMLPGCAQNEYSPLHRYKEAKTYDPLTVKNQVDANAKKFKTPGFLGLHLGMTVDDVNDLVINTPWGYEFCPAAMISEKFYNENWPDYPQTQKENYLKNDKSLMGATWLNIGCEGPVGKGRCYWLDNIVIKFKDGTLKK